MQQCGKLDQVLSTRTGHVREGQVEALKISKGAGLEETGQIVILKRNTRIFLENIHAGGIGTTECWDIGIWAHDIVNTAVQRDIMKCWPFVSARVMVLLVNEGKQQAKHVVSGLLNPDTASIRCCPLVSCWWYANKHLEANDRLNLATLTLHDLVNLTSFHGRMGFYPF